MSTSLPRIGIAGVTGRMGGLLLEAAAIAGVPVVGGTSRRPNEATVPVMSLRELAASCDVVIDFTNASTVAATAPVLEAAGTAWVLGSSGLSIEDERRVAKAAGRIAVVYAANFGPGVNVLLSFARQLAATLPSTEYDAEIVEMHHRGKVDAPSGTAMALGRAVAEGRNVTLENVMVAGREGQTGARPQGSIGFASLRGGQVVGEHTLLFAADGEQIALTHRALDRGAFAAGAIRAATWLHGRPPGLYRMVDVLGLA